MVGYPLAYYIVRHVKRQALRRLIYIVVVTPLFTSNIVRAFGWIVLLGRRGLVNDTLIGLALIDRPVPLLYGQFSIVLGLVYIMLPFMVLTVASVLQNIERSLEDAARDLGCTAWSAFCRVTFPLSLPGVIAGSLIVFTLSVSAYVTPSILSGGREIVMSMLIFQQYGAVLNFEFGAALSVSSSSRRWFWSRALSGGARSRRRGRACEGMRVDRVMERAGSVTPVWLFLAGGAVPCAAADHHHEHVLHDDRLSAVPAGRVYASVVRQVPGRRLLCGFPAAERRPGRELATVTAIALGMPVALVLTRSGFPAGRRSQRCFCRP